MSLTGRPNSPPSALVSSSQIFIANNAALPLAARPPVNPMPNPILIGSTARVGKGINPMSASPRKNLLSKIIVLPHLGIVLPPCEQQSQRRGAQIQKRRRPTSQRGAKHQCLISIDIVAVALLQPLSSNGVSFPSIAA